MFAKIVYTRLFNTKMLPVNKGKFGLFWGNCWRFVEPSSGWMPNIHANIGDEQKHRVSHPNFLLLYVNETKLCSYECKRVSVRGKKNTVLPYSRSLAILF